MKTETQRLFIAIPLPGGVKKTLTEVQRELREQLPPRAASWPKGGHLHLTLRFLGAVPRNLVDALTVSLRQALKAVMPFDVRCERLGVFPDLRYPRVVWAGVHDDKEQLQALQAAVEQGAGSFSAEPAGKRFTGHITVARIRQIKRPEAGIIGQFVESRKETTFGQWRVNRVSLMESDLRPEGAVHIEVAGFELREAGSSDP